MIELGYQIVGVSPDPPEKIAAMQDENDYVYTLLSDHSFDAALAFGLAFEVPAKTRERYKGYGIPLYSRDDGGPVLLPVPAVYLVDPDGKIEYSYFDVDYTVRLDAAELLAEAKKLASGS